MKNILITGASSGVGKELSIYLSKKFNVIAIARRKDKMLLEFEEYSNIFCYELDVSDDIEMLKVLSEIKDNHGDIPYIINNAGVLISGEIEDLDFTNEIEYSIKVNALAPLKIINYFIYDMKKNNFGRIINLTSGAPLNCFANFGAYSASKAVLNSLSVTLAKELTNYNIKVNLMSPGPVQSEMSPDAELQPNICFPTVDYLLDLNKSTSTGGFYWLGYKVPLFPDLDGVQWIKGIGNEKLEKVL